MYVRASEPMAGEEKLMSPPVMKLQASEDVWGPWYWLCPRWCLSCLKRGHGPRGSGVLVCVGVPDIVGVCVIVGVNVIVGV